MIAVKYQATSIESYYIRIINKFIAAGIHPYSECQIGDNSVPNILSKLVILLRKEVFETYENYLFHEENQEASVLGEIDI